ncbi:hypothetical protein FYA67_07390 [Bordetella holmesii]|nr:hypothetical protein [Bordetella holmesii]MBO1244260.1 hypothetical protein [Bordetella holmesii]MBO1247396.1 hypothetical protein [Bordetella holmesii]MBO1252234.1 hypothetical protein [Bordetella holmesii]MBO1259857.1 hypothetical protein [Bordetella holmesii]
MLVGNYDPTLVLISLGVAILASYTALGMASCELSIGCIRPG